MKKNDLPDEINENIKNADNFRNALEVVITSINHFPIHDRRLSINTNYSIAISGVVDSEMIKDQVKIVLDNLNFIKQVINSLTVYECKRKVILNANGTIYVVKNLQEIQDVFDKYKNEDFVCYSLKEESNDSILKLRMNRTYSTAIIYDTKKELVVAASFKSNHNKKLIHHFINESGKPIIHPDSEVVENRDGYDIMRNFLLFGEKFDGIEWD